MSFNPNLPANNSPISSAELRGQFNALKTRGGAADSVDGLTEAEYS